MNRVNVAQAPLVMLTRAREMVSNGAKAPTMELAMGKKVERSSLYRKALLKSQAYWGEVCVSGILRLVASTPCAGWQHLGAVLVQC
jgi:hypothetical protein